MSRSTPTEKAARMLDLVPYIQARQGIALSELALAFNVSEEELLSDLQALWMCGENRFDLIDLEFESGFVSIRNAHTLNRVRTFSQQEVVSILLGLDILRQDLSGMGPELIKLLDQVKVKIGAGTERLIAASAGISGVLNAQIHKALKERSALEIEYHSAAEDKVSKRIIEPLEESVRDGRPVLLAYCHSAKGRRSFRVDRIIFAQVAERPAPQEALQEPLSPEISAQLRVHRNRRTAIESLGSYLTPNSDGYEVRAFSAPWLLRVVISLSGAVEVSAPNPLRAEIARKASQILKIYSQKA